MPAATSRGTMQTVSESGYTPCAMSARTNLCPRRLVLTCAVTSLLLCASLSAQEPTAAPSHAAAILDSMPRAKRISEVALSPDGSLVAYVVNGELAVMPASG